MQECATSENVEARGATMCNKESAGTPQQITFIPIRDSILVVTVIGSSVSDGYLRIQNCKRATFQIFQSYVRCPTVRTKRKSSYSRVVFVLCYLFPGSAVKDRQAKDHVMQ